MVQKNIQDSCRFVAMVAKKQNWTLNPDTEFTDSLVEGLTINYNRYGYYLCPCRDTEGSREADADVLCPCKYAWDDIAQAGHCFCALYLRPDFAESGQPPGGIPDKRYQNT